MNTPPIGSASEALEAAATVADEWAAENRAACVRAHKSRSEGARAMADQLGGAAIECNAIAAAIRKLSTRIAPAAPMGFQLNAGIEKTLILTVTINEDMTDIEVDFQRDPKRWTCVRDAIAAGAQRLQEMLADQFGCPARPKSAPTSADCGQECHGLDTSERVCFYEQDFYVLSNFSSFNVRWGPYTLPTSEHLYHWRRFFLAGGIQADTVAYKIQHAPSAHEAFKLAQDNKRLQVDHWDDIKVGEMREILRLKAAQHEYVRRKLLATGDRELVENSWRDDFWGWGPNRDGQNMLGKLWMEVRAELRALVQS